MARPRTRTDEQILAAARQVFLSRGPGATMTDIAAAVGISQPAISHRFGSRHALFVRALTPVGIPEWIDALRQPVGDRDAKDVLIALAEKGLAVLVDAVPCMVTLRAGNIDLSGLVPEQDDMPHVLVEQAVIAWFEREARLGNLSPGDPTARGVSFIGVLQARALWAHVARAPLKSDDIPVQARALVDVLWYGINPRGES